MLKRGLVMNRALLQSAFINKQTNHTCSYIIIILKAVGNKLQRKQINATNKSKKLYMVVF